MSFFLLRASIGGTERVRLSREAANAEVVQSKVVLSQGLHCVGAIHPNSPRGPVALQNMGVSWGQFEAIISIFYCL